jgi:hypothetical protein
MNKLITAMAATALALGTGACGEMAGGDAAEAASIAGTWKADVESAEFENNVNRYLLADGEYTCESCLPPYSITANGEWQTLDRPGYDGQMFEVVDDSTVKSASRRGEKELGGATWTVSEDGQSMTIEWTNLDGDEVVSGSTIYARADAGPEGSHAISGGWTVSELGEMSDAGLTFGYTIDGDQYGSTGNGSNFVATLGGDAVAIEGNESNVMVAVEQTGDNSYRETYTRDGEVLSVLDISIDGDTMSAVSKDPRDDSVVRWTASRQ